MPDFKFNLWSVSALSRSLNCVVLLLTDHCIQDHTRGSLIGNGSRAGELYFLDLNTPLVDIVGVSLLVVLVYLRLICGIIDWSPILSKALFYE